MLFRPIYNCDNLHFNFSLLWLGSIRFIFEKLNYYVAEGSYPCRLLHPVLDIRWIAVSWPNTFCQKLSTWIKWLKEKIVNKFLSFFKKKIARVRALPNLISINFANWLEEVCNIGLRSVEHKLNNFGQFWLCFA